MKNQIIIKDENGEVRLQQTVENGETILVEAGDEILLIDENGNAAEVALTPEGSDLIVGFVSGEQLILEEYFSSAGVAPPINLNVSPSSNTVLYDAHFANSDPAAPGNTNSPTGSSTPTHEGPPSQLLPTSGDPLGPADVSFEGGVGNLPQGQDFTLMRLSNLGFTEFEETFSSFSEDVSAFVAADETPAPRGFGGGSPGQPEVQFEPQAAPEPLPPSAPPVVPPPAPTPTPPVAPPPAIPDLPPLANDDDITTDEDLPIDIAVIANDFDLDGGTISVSTVGTPTNGTTAINLDGSIRYTPNPNFFGTDTFTYEITDNDGLTDTATVTVTVNSVDDLPVAVNDALSVDEDDSISGTLVSNDTPSGDGGNVWALASNPSNGVATVNTDGTYSYTPNANFNGSDSFTYTVTDADGDVSTATASVTVNSVDDLPVAVNDALSVDEDDSISGTLATNDTPSGDGGNIWALASNPTNGVATVNADGSYSYTPNANFNGSDSFTYTITDADGDVSTATASVTVNSVDDLPVAVNDALSVEEDDSISGTLVTNDTPSGDGGNIWALASNPTNGVATVNADGSYSYTPNANYNGSDSFTYTITDADGDVSTATASVTVNSVDDLPVAVNDALSVDEDDSVSGTLATNDTPSGDGGNVWALASNPTNGVATVNTDGTYSYTPNANYNGSDSFTYTITDADGDVSTATASITVNSVDDLPVAVNDVLSVDEDDSVSGTLATNDTPSGDGGNVWALASNPTNGVATVNADGSYSYAPNANFNGSDSFTYTITDADGDVSTATASVTVNSVDDLPVAVNDALSVDEDNSISGTLATNDTPSGDGGNTWAIASNPTNGVATVNANGSYSYTPNANFNGSDSFTYTITDADGDVSTATASVTVNSVDDLPVAVNDALSVDEDDSISGTLATNDTPSGDGGNVWALASNPNNGVTTVNANGTYTYTPDANFNGSDSFTYTITDADGDVSTATASITVNSVDDAPVAADDALSVDEDDSISGTLATNDTPSGDGGNIWAIASNPTNGVATVNANGTYTYTPNANFNGSDSFTYTITDADGDVSTATAAVTVNSVDDAPVATDDALSVDEDDSVSGTLATNDTPSGDGGNTWAIASNPSNGVATVNANGTYTYTPNANFNGSDSFTYTITDVDGDVSTATAAITVNSVDDAPVAVNDALSVDEDDSISGTLATNDTPSGDGGNIWAIASNPTNGVATVNANGTYTYTPNANFNGSDSFTYTITDADGDVSTATAAVTVNSVDDAPVAADDALSVDEDDSVSGTLATNDTPSGDGGNTWAIASNPSNGVATVNANGTYTYTPNANFNGSDSFTYTITDVDGDVSTATAAITVNSVDDAPVALNDALSVDEDDSVSGTLATNDTPSGDGGNTWAIASNPSNGVATVNANGSYTYTPNANFNGSDSFTYTITDADGDISTATAAITVNSIDDAPLAVNDALSVDEDDSVSGTLATNDTPSGDGGNTWAIASNPTNGVATVNANGSYTYTPNANFNGSDSFTYTITDADGDISTATAAITVNSIDDAPLAVNDALSVDEDDSVFGTLATNDTPSGDGGNTWATASNPTNGVATVNANGTYTYTPNANFNGSDSFTYTITDADGDVSTATAAITVNSIDDAPLAVNDALSVDEDDSVSGTLATNDTPSGDGGNTWAIASNPSNGVATVNANGTYTYTPDANFNGSDSFTYTITDADGDVSTATAAITVNSVDDVPVAADDALSVDEDDSVSGTLATNDTPSADGGNTWALASNPSNGVATGNANGTYTYTPDANFNGSDSFTYTITDADGDVSTATASVTVNSVDDAPVAVNDALSVDEDDSVSGTLATNDTPSGDGGNTWALASSPTNGVATVNANGTYTYTPVANFNGSDSFTYTITDADGDISTATASITVNSVDDTPAAVNDTVSVDEDNVLSDTVAGNDTLSGDGGNVFAAASNPGNGSVTMNADGSYDYTPDADFNGNDSFTYTLTDADGDVSTATVNITVNPINDPPRVTDDRAASGDPMGSPLTIDILANDTDVDGTIDPTTVDLDPSTNGIQTSFTVTDEGTWTSDGAGNVTFTPEPGLISQPTPITYTVQDNDGATSATATITALFSAADVWFGNDESGSVNGPDFSQSRNLISGTANLMDFGSEDVGFNAALFSWSFSAEQQMEIGLTDSRTDFVSDSSSYNRNYNGNTDIGAAIAFGTAQIEASVAARQASGHPRADVPQVMVILTDAFDWQIEDDTSLLADAQAAKDAGITLVIVAIQEAQETESAVDVLKAAASEDGNGDPLVVTADSYASISPTDMADLLQTIREGAAASLAPVVIDRDGDGVEFDNVEEGIAFDADGDGQLEQVAWADEDDAVLVYDHNGDGDVTERSEIAFVDYKEGAETDLEGLQHFDTDNDLMLTADDAEFEAFGLWQDANGNGRVDEGEFQTLSEAGVKSIGLQSDQDSYRAADGDVEIHGESTVEYEDGTSAIAADAEFAYREVDQSAIVEPEGSEAPLEVVTADGDVVNLDASTPDQASPAEVAPEIPESENSEPAPGQDVTMPLQDDSSAAAAAASM